MYRKADLDGLAQAQGRNRDTLIDEALSARLDLQAWQTLEIRSAFGRPGLESVQLRYTRRANRHLRST